MSCPPDRASSQSSDSAATTQAVSLYHQGTDLEQRGENRAALDCYRQAIALKADYYEAWVRQGLVLMLLQELSSALASFNQALALNRSLDLAWYLKAYCHMVMDAEELAQLALRKALTLAPEQWGPMAAQEPVFVGLKDHPDFPELG